MRKIKMVKRVPENYEVTELKQTTPQTPTTQSYNRECVPCVTFLNGAVFEEMAAEYGGSPETYANTLSTMGMVGDNIVLPAQDPYSLGFSEAIRNTVGSMVQNMIDLSLNSNEIYDTDLYKLHCVAGNVLSDTKFSFAESLSYKIKTCLSNAIYDILYDILSRYVEKAGVNDESVVFDMMESILADMRIDMGNPLMYKISSTIKDMVFKFSNLNLMEFTEDSAKTENNKDDHGLGVEREAGLYFIRSKMYTLHAEIINDTFFLITNKLRHLVYTNKFFMHKNPNITILAMQDLLSSSYIPCLSNIMKSELSKVINIIADSSILLLGDDNLTPNLDTYDFKGSTKHKENSRLFIGSKQLPDDYENNDYGNFTYCEF